MKRPILNSIVTTAFTLLIHLFSYGQSSNIAPTLTATGDQLFCPGFPMKIVTNMTIVDPDDTGIDAVYIQISSGYSSGQDVLNLTGLHPSINTSWSTLTGTLTLSGVSAQPTYTDLIAAIKDVAYSCSSSNPTGSRTFSITVGQANYLPSTGHYYKYIPALGVTWTDAKNYAQASTYYGIQGYLATITSAAEAQICGAQASGTGWIGGSDASQEGVWKWVCGPENGTVFWNGTFQGSTTTFAFWNAGEPNNMGGSENYAHVTAPGVGITGSWNDLSNTGDSSGNYQPKGYIVEYGGMPNDPVLHISTSTTITIPSITNASSNTICGTGSVALQAVSNTGTVNWYDSPSGGNYLGSGNNFNSPIINSNTVFYMAPHSNGCPDNSRTPLTALVTPKPILTVTSPYFMCEEEYKIINVSTTSGIMYWYDSQTSTTPIFLGTHFIVPNIHNNTTFYAEADYNGCHSVRSPVLVNVFAAPLAADENYEVCQGTILTLNAGNPNMTYLWSSGETTQTITTNGLTNYSVTITTPAPESCSKTKQFYIIYNAPPIIESVLVQESTITIITSQSGNFEYSIDGNSYQASNSFTVPEGGIYTCYVREKNQCGMDKTKVAVILYPDYFTPNGDGYNDVWTIKGMSNYPSASIQIFDRFGKLISVLHGHTNSWDGTFNGKPLPASDYWFVAKLIDSLPETKGHFAIKR
ncbi:T9SS type B sorting domain-containing protein [Flavobacterium sp. SUN046]|uniref:T9SS type B sorting domain-containing protein n=1 Tax=Flavobacterium sp. SUN046 TaxID=3002440 RepID=UPI002DBABE29|nr:T9SS type B sorting domain-containing protein [Flavobacterium sp. SUN046]MEC4047801.1 T9SS type B sorting domain-containing protein [Flavobacterium sp. SUN046]